MGLLKSWRARWKARRMDLAMKQIGAPSDDPADMSGGPDAYRNMALPPFRQEIASTRRLRSARSSTEWKGD
jgi:hypothetical protein